MSSGQTNPFGESRGDEAYVKRNRRAAWLNLYGAAGRLVLATSPEAKKKAENDLLKFRDRLTKLGVASEDAP